MQKLFNLMFDWFWGNPEPMIREDHEGFVEDEMLAEYAEMQVSFKEKANDARR